MPHSSPSDWPGDLQTVFAAVSVAMRQGRLSPLVCDRISDLRDAVLPGHAVTVRHVPKHVSGDKVGHYTIEIVGDRWRDGASWRFFSGELEQLARKSSS